MGNCEMSALFSDVIEHWESIKEEKGRQFTELYVLSPYITGPTLRQLLPMLKTGRVVKVLTLFEAGNFASRASSLDEVQYIFTTGRFELFHAANLHAKVIAGRGRGFAYVSIGSQNVTEAGRNRREASVVVSGDEYYEQVKKEIQRWIKEDQKITQDMIDLMRTKVADIQNLAEEHKEARNKLLDAARNVDEQVSNITKRKKELKISYKDTLDPETESIPSVVYRSNEGNLYLHLESGHPHDRLKSYPIINRSTGEFLRCRLAQTSMSIFYDRWGSDNIWVNEKRLDISIGSIPKPLETGHYHNLLLAIVDRTLYHKPSSKLILRFWATPDSLSFSGFEGMQETFGESDVQLRDWLEDNLQTLMETAHDLIYGAFKVDPPVKYKSSRTVNTVFGLELSRHTITFHRHPKGDIVLMTGDS